MLAIQGRTLVLGGVDIVDGSPILDIKPYVSAPLQGLAGSGSYQHTQQPVAVSIVVAIMAAWAGSGANATCLRTEPCCPLGRCGVLTSRRAWG